jgi:hypothetical protein
LFVDLDMMIPISLVVLELVVKLFHFALLLLLDFLVVRVNNQVLKESLHFNLSLGSHFLILDLVQYLNLVSISLGLVLALRDGFILRLWPEARRIVLFPLA